MEPIEEGPETSLLHPSGELVQESEDTLDIIPFGSDLSEISDYTDKTRDFSLPDAHTLLYVTSRRKNHQNRAGLPLEGSHSEEQLSEFAELCFEDDAKTKLDDMKVDELTSNCPQLQISPFKSYSSSICHLTEGASQGHNLLTLRESEAIIVIKHLQEQIESLEVEKNSVQMNLDNVVALAAEQNASFREKYEDLQKDVWNAREQASATHEQMCLLSNQNFTEINGDTTFKLSLSMGEIASHFSLLRIADNNVLATTEECFQFFSILSEVLESFKMLPRQCMMQYKSIISDLERINNIMSKKYTGVELEKNILSNQLYDHQKEIYELKFDFEKREKIFVEQGLQHDMEKDELLSQVLDLQKEVSQLSSSSLAREKEALRKELDKSKSKLKDTEYKLKNSIQDKVKLEGEKALAEREIKSLQGQRALLDRDILKRDSLFDKRCESRSDFNKVRGLNPAAQQNLQNDYEELEFIALEMENEISSLKESLEITIGEKEEASIKNEILNSELENMADKLNTAYFEMELLKEEIGRMEQRLADSESSSRGLEDSLNLLSSEKEEIILQFTEALLQVEAEKSAWAFNEKALNEKLKMSNCEIVKLSENLSEVIKELDLCKDQCNGFRENLYLAEENVKRENSSASAEVHNLKSTLLRVTEERDNLFFKVEQLRRLQDKMEIFEGKYDDLRSNSDVCFQELNHRISDFEVKMKEVLQNAYESNIEKSELRMKLGSTEAKLDTYRSRLKEALNERKVMDNKYQEASTMLKNQLRTYGQHILDLTKQLSEKD